MGAMTAKPADCFAHFLLAKHLGRRRDVLASESRHDFFCFERNYGLVGKDMATGGTGKSFACALKSLIHYLALEERILAASRAEDFNRSNGCVMIRFFHKKSVWGKYVVVVKNGDA